VIGTAGHIDHGKSTLVRALTGTDPDRLSEEKIRGMTIDLGFASMELPGGDAVSFVDVPGHDRFVANMLAGVTGIDAFLLVVAGDEGVMPQTREHVEILDLLGIRRGIAVITKADLIDEDMQEIVRAELHELLAATCISPPPVLAVSASTGEGLPQLIEALEGLIPTSDQSPDGGSPRLPIDRVFTVKGFGTVVTGTSSGGPFEVGQEVEVLPGGARARIRGLQSHGRSLQKIESGRRTALNLAGVERPKLDRGNVVSEPGSMRSSRRVDAIIRVLRSAPQPLRTMDELSLHVGAAEAMVRIFPLQSGSIEQGCSGWAQLRLDRPLAVWRRQRGVLRRLSPSRTVAGAEILDIGPRRRSREEDIQRLAGLQSETPDDVVLSLLSERGRSIPDLMTLLSVTKEQLEPILSSLTRRGLLESIGSHYLTASQAQTLRDHVQAIVEEYHSKYPLRQGIPREELRRRARVSNAGLDDVLAPLYASCRLTAERTTVAVPTHLAAGSSGQTEAQRGLEDMVKALHSSGLMPPPIAALQHQYQIDDEGLRHLVQRGRVVRIESDVYVSAPAYQMMIESVVGLIADEGKVTIARLRDSLGVTRKYALVYAEHLDARHITRREGDQRVSGRDFHAYRP
jgi:selenocysteine-specific elongation factor